MASASDSDDASELFWPGYVDAVTNLAINLLFVIAIMAIVVMTANLQISQMQPKQTGILDESNEKPTAGAKLLQKEKYQDTLDTVIKAQTIYKKMLEQSEDNPNIALRQAPTVKELEKVLHDLEGKLQQSMKAEQDAERRITNSQIQQNEKLLKLQQKLDEITKQETLKSKDKNRNQNEEQNTEAVGKQKDSEKLSKLQIDALNGVETDNSNKPLQEVLAQQRVNPAIRGQSKLQDLSAGGIVVVFSNDVIELSDTEVAELVKKLTTSGPVKGARWQLRVASPKGFSEATRIAYYRLNSLRNILLKNGALSADIEMRVIETEETQANNARVLIRQMP